MDFETIPGQDKLKKAVRAQLSSNNWPHSTIIGGPEGVPSLSFALAVAHELLTSELEGSAAERASAKVSKLIHPDLHISFPFQGPKNRSDDFLSELRSEILKNPFMSLSEWASVQAGERKQLNISVNECQNIIRKLSLKAFEGGSKVMIIWGAEYLGNDGNRLLKLLEEPTPQTFIILVTEALDKILPTIISRCQMYRLLPLTDAEMRRWLQDKMDVAEVNVENIVRASEGSVHSASRMIAMADAEVTDVLTQWLDIVSKADFEGMLNFSLQINGLNKEAQKLVFNNALTMLRGSLNGEAPSNVIFAGVQDHLRLDFVTQISTVLNEVLEGIERNAHVQSLLMSKSIGLWKWMKSNMV